MQIITIEDEEHEFLQRCRKRKDYFRSININEYKDFQRMRDIVLKLDLNEIKTKTKTAKNIC